MQSVQVLEAWMNSGSVNNLQYLNLDTCDSLNEIALTGIKPSLSLTLPLSLSLSLSPSRSLLFHDPSFPDFTMRCGHQLRGLCLGGHHKLLEYFWMNMIPQLRNIKYGKTLLMKKISDIVRRIEMNTNYCLAF